MKGPVTFMLGTGIMIIGLIISGMAFYKIPITSQSFYPTYYTGVLLAISAIFPILLGSINSFWEKVDEVIEHNKRFDEEQNKIEQKQNQSGFPKEIV